VSSKGIGLLVQQWESGSPRRKLVEGWDQNLSALVALAGPITSSLKTHADRLAMERYAEPMECLLSEAKYATKDIITPDRGASSKLRQQGMQELGKEDIRTPS